MEIDTSTTRSADLGRTRTGALSVHWWQLALGVVLFGVAVLFRLSAAEDVFTPRGVRLLTVDAYLHFRRILLTAQQFPGVSSFDPYANYPQGVVVTWPPLWDWSVALLGRALALGRFDESALLTAAAVFPVAVGVATVLAVGALAWVLFGRTAVWPSAFFAAASPALRLTSQVGNVDHHAGVSLGAVLIAIATALVTRLPERGVKASGREMALRALLLGFAIWGSLMVWLGSILPAFLSFLFFFLLALVRGHQSSRRVATAGWAFVVAGLALLPFLAAKEPTFGGMSSLQVSALVVGGAVLLASAVVARRKGRTPILAVLVLVGVGLVVGVTTGALRPVVDAALAGVVKAFGWYPWAQQTNEWLPLLEDDGGSIFSNAEVLYGKLVYVVPLLLSALIVRDVVAAFRRSEGTLPQPSVASHDQSRLGSRASFYVFALAFLGMALTARVYHQLFAPVTAVVWGAALVLLADSVVVPLLRVVRVRVAPRSSATPEVVLVVLVALALILNNLGTERLGMALPKDLVAAMEWLESRTPSPGDTVSSAAHPDYGVMSTWQYGDFIAGLAKRPVAADGANEWNLDGFVTAQRFFQTTSSEEANGILDDLRMRYVLVGSQFTYVDGDLTRAGPPTGWIDRLAPRNLWHNELPADVRAGMLYNRLYAPAFARPDTPIAGLSRLRLIYIGSEDRMPLLVYEHVPGATLVGQSTPGAEVAAAIRLANSRGQQFFFYFATAADADGRFRLTVPYATSWLSQGLATSDAYMLVVGSNPVGTARVGEDQVRDGREVSLN